MIKKYNKIRFRQKFRRYRIFFLVCAALFIFALILESTLYGSGGFTAFGGKISFEGFFTRLALGEMLIYLMIFFLGLTIYAPFFAFLISFLRGAFSGFCLSCVFSGIEHRGAVLLFLFTFFYVLSSAWLFMGYASFCASCALRLYSSSAESSQKEEKRMFGGTLFQSTLFCGTVNLRFLFSYFLIFLASLFFCALLALLYAYLRSLI